MALGMGTYTPPPVSTPGTRQQYQATQPKGFTSIFTSAATRALGAAGAQGRGNPWDPTIKFSDGSTQSDRSAAQLAAQIVQAQQGPSDAAYNAKRNELVFDQGQASTQRDRAIENLGADTTSAINRLGGEKYRNVDLGLAGVQADRTYWDQIAGAFQQETQNLADDQNAQRAFIARALGIEASQLDAQTGYAGESRGLADQQSQLSYDTGARQARSDATGRGAISSTGYSDTRNELLQQLGLSKAGNDLDYRSTLTDIGGRRQTAQLTADRGEQSLASAWKQREVDTTRNTATVTRGRSDADRTEASLNSLAADYGMQESDLRDRLRRGAEQANMDYASTVAAIQQALASNDEGQRASALAIASSLAGV